MLILIVLIVGFGVAAYVVSRGGGDAIEHDQAIWCDGAGPLADRGEIFDGTAADASVDDLEAVKLALFDVETIAPFDLWDDIATLADFTLIAQQQRRDLDWPEAFVAARENKEARIDAAIAELEAEMATCGLRLG
jgi:hypothetical protein